MSGEKSTVTPEGCPLDVRVTGDEKSLMELIVTIADVDPPGDVLTVWGETAILKSPGAGAAVTCREKS